MSSPISPSTATLIAELERAWDAMDEVGRGEWYECALQRAPKKARKARRK